MKTHFNIKGLSSEDQPREKLLEKGKSSLTNAELLGILLGSGSKDLNAVELAQLILSSVNNDINKLARLTIADLEKFKGIGEAKAITIVSAMELSRRRPSDSHQNQIQKITTSKDVYDLMKPFLQDLTHEEFWIITLARNNKVIGKSKISQGGLSGTTADPKVIFKIALDHKASAIIVTHNHPSGNHQPSQADIRLTKKLKDAGDVLDIPLLDHIIFCDQSYLSFADENYL